MAKLEDERSKDGEGAAVTEEWQLEPGVVSKLYDVFTVAGLRVDAIELAARSAPSRCHLALRYARTILLHGPYCSPRAQA
jgi:hypothetical protein